MSSLDQASSEYCVSEGGKDHAGADANSCFKTGPSSSVTEIGFVDHNGIDRLADLK
jgi:hypothetical protein